MLESLLYFKGYLIISLLLVGLLLTLADWEPSSMRGKAGKQYLMVLIAIAMLSVVTYYLRGLTTP
jgi:hypothetical protein